MIAYKKGKQCKYGYLLVVSKIRKQIIFLLNRQEISFQQNTSVCYLKLVKEICMEYFLMEISIFTTVL